MIHYLWGFFIMIFCLYLLFEIMSVIIHKRPYAYLLYLSYRLHKNVRKQIPECFIIKISTFTITIDGGFYNVYVEIRSNLYKKAWTNDWMLVNGDGSIFRTDLFNNMNNKFPDFIRDEKLKKLGI